MPPLEYNNPVTFVNYLYKSTPLVGFEALNSTFLLTINIVYTRIYYFHETRILTQQICKEFYLLHENSIHENNGFLSHILPDTEYYLKVKNSCQIKIQLKRYTLEINSHVYYFNSLAIVRKKHIKLAIVKTFQF